MAVDVKLEAYREGFADALRWVLEVFNLDTEDEDELNRVLEGGECEGDRAPEDGGSSLDLMAATRRGDLISDARVAADCQVPMTVDPRAVLEALGAEPFATIIAPFDKCANCGATASENVTWSRTGGWTCAACGESDYPEAAE